MFPPAISGELLKVLDHSDAIGVTQNEDLTSGLVAKADALKAKVVKPDPFVERSVIALFADECTRMKIPDADENGVTRWKARIIGRSDAELIKRGRPRKETKPTTPRKRRPRKRTPVSDLRVVPFLPPVSHGRSFYVAGSVSHQ